MKGDLDHMRFNFETAELHCEACDDRYMVNLPCPIDMMSAIFTVWKRMHKKCKKKS